MRNTSLQILRNPFCLLNVLLGLETYVFQLLIIYYLYRSLPARIPLWNNQFFLSDRLDTQLNILFLPLIGIIMLVLNTTLVEKLLQKREKLLAATFSFFTLASQAVLTTAVFRIVLRSSAVYLNIPSYHLIALLSFGLAFLLGFILSPISIRFAKKYSLVDDPEVRRKVHPAILHHAPIPRAGALPILIAILITGLIFVPLSGNILAIYLGAMVMVITGILDDKYDLSPYVRIILQLVAAIIVLIGGIGITYFTNPFGGLLWLNQIQFSLLGHTLYPIAILFALFWIVWVMNMVNWSNGVDGQFPCIVSIATIVIGLLSLRLIPYDEKQINVLFIAMITAGAVLGTAPFNWHPAKMFYGFGSTMLGLILASLSMLAGAKVATALLVLVVPSFDAVFTILRRVTKGKSPVWGDRAHLHHRLYNLGWTHPQISTFYAITTALFGALALYSSGKYKLLTIIAGAGLVAFLLIILRRKMKGTGEVENA